MLEPQAHLLFLVTVLDITNTLVDIIDTVLDVTNTNDTLLCQRGRHDMWKASAFPGAERLGRLRFADQSEKQQCCQVGGLDGDYLDPFASTYTMYRYTLGNLIKRTRWEEKRGIEMKIKKQISWIQLYLS